MTFANKDSKTVLFMDKLDKIFEMQAGLNKRILGDRSQPLSDEDKVQWILNYSRALQQEISELIDSVPWKWWAKYQKLDLQNAKVEVVDALHFLVSLAQVLGLTAEDLFEAYCKKNKINFQRQDNGYFVKDEEDSRGI